MVLTVLYTKRPQTSLILFGINCLHMFLNAAVWLVCTFSAGLAVATLSESGLETVELSGWKRTDVFCNHESHFERLNEAFRGRRVYPDCSPSPRSGSPRRPSLWTGPARSACLCCSSCTLNSWKQEQKKARLTSDRAASNTLKANSKENHIFGGFNIFLLNFSHDGKDIYKDN